MTSGGSGPAVPAGAGEGCEGGLSEAEDLLVNRTPDGTISYDTFSKIGFFDNVLSGNATSQVITSGGWEINLGEIFSLSSGDYKDIDGNVIYGTEGFGINFTGFVRLIALFDPTVLDSDVFKFIHDKIDFEYYHAEIDNNGANPVSGTSFNGLRISLF